MNKQELEAGTRCLCGEDLTDHEDAHRSRRTFLSGAIAATTAMLTGGALLSPSPALAQSSITPEAALKELMDGNHRYVRGRLQQFDEHRLSLRKAKTSEKQEPFAALLSCSDSRVPVELIFDQGIGDLFVVRVAGNVATPEIIASLEYGVAVLGTEVLMVLGHGSCGAVKAAMEGKAAPGQISALYAPLRPAVDAAGRDLDAAIDANARIQAKLISLTSPIIAAAIEAGKLKVVAARYDLASGKVSLLG